MWILLQRESIWVTYLILVWRIPTPPRKRYENGSGHLLKCGSRLNGSLFWPPTSFWFGDPPPNPRNDAKIDPGNFQNTAPA